MAIEGHDNLGLDVSTVLSQPAGWPSRLARDSRLERRRGDARASAVPTGVTGFSPFQYRVGVRACAPGRQGQVPSQLRRSYGDSKDKQKKPKQDKKRKKQRQHQDTKKAT